MESAFITNILIDVSTFEASSGFSSNAAYPTIYELDHLDPPSTVQCIPTEILLMIFLFLDFSEANLFQTSGGPWLLTKVCSRWREIVLDYPLFWTHVNVDLSYRGYSSGHGQGARADLLLSTFVERSKNLPLNVQIRWRNVEDASEDAYNGMTVLLSTCHRWKKAVLDLHSTLFYEISPTIMGRLSELEVLNLSLNLPDKYLRNRRSVIDAFQIAPKLRDVRIDGSSYATRNVRLPWSQITHLNVYHNHPNPNYHCLRLSLNLVECDLGAHGHLLHSPNGPYQAIELPHLKKLVVRGSATLVLWILTAPKLEVLHVLSSQLAIPCIDAVRYFVQVCSESLKDLALESDPLDYRVAEVLYVTRGLVKLSLHLALPKGSSLFEDLLKWLSYKREPKECLLPRLEVLTMDIYCPVGEPFNARAVTRMLLSRRARPLEESHRDLMRLQRFDMKVNSRWTPDFNGFSDLRCMDFELKLCLR